MALGFGLPGAAVPGESERTHLKLHRTNGTSAEVDLQPGEFSVSTLPALHGVAADLTAFTVRSQAYNDATYQPLDSSLTAKIAARAFCGM